jgi:hypothetical protein
MGVERGSRCHHEHLQQPHDGTTGTNCEVHTGKGRDGRGVNKRVSREGVLVCENKIGRLTFSTLQTGADLVTA